MLFIIFLLYQMKSHNVNLIILLRKNDRAGKEMINTTVADLFWPNAYELLVTVHRFRGSGFTGNMNL